MSRCETVMIKDKEVEAGYRIINKEDLSNDDLILDEPPKKKAPKGGDAAKNEGDADGQAGE